MAQLKTRTDLLHSLEYSNVAHSRFQRHIFQVDWRGSILLNRSLYSSGLYDHETYTLAYSDRASPTYLKTGNLYNVNTSTINIVLMPCESGYLDRLTDLAA